VLDKEAWFEGAFNRCGMISPILKVSSLEGREPWEIAVVCRLVAVVAMLFCEGVTITELRLSVPVVG
jgi:hypothetical protein